MGRILPAEDSPIIQEVAVAMAEGLQLSGRA